MTRPKRFPDAKRFAHGTRARYVTGCHCAECRKANTEYVRQRTLANERGDHNPIILAARAKAHLFWLREHGVGSRVVSRVSGVGRTIVHEITAGRRPRIRRSTEQRILAVAPSQRGLGAIVPAAKTWERIETLRRAGWTKGRIAQALGAKTPALQLKKTRVTTKTVIKVRDLLRTELAKRHRLH